jgi:hypothetical protein
LKGKENREKGFGVLWTDSVTVTRTNHMFDLTALSTPGFRSADLVGRALLATAGAGGAFS